MSNCAAGCEEDGFEGPDDACCCCATSNSNGGWICSGLVIGSEPGCGSLAIKTSDPVPFSNCPAECEEDVFYLGPFPFPVEEPVGDAPSPADDGACCCCAAFYGGGGTWFCNNIKDIGGDK